MLHEIMNDYLQPFPCLFLLCAAIIIWWWRRKPEARRVLSWIAAPFAALWLLCMPLTGYLALGSLEWSYPPAGPRPSDIGAIVVLSGGISVPNSFQPKPVLTEDTVYRCLHAVEVYHEGPPCKVLLSGGKVNPSKPGPQLAEAMQALMLQLGVRSQDVVLESASRTTYENAVFSARILKQQLGIRRVVLVTDAAHLPRAVRCFRAQGIEVIPSGCRYRASACPSIFVALLPQPGAVLGVQAALHEWLGLAWYGVSGRF